MRSYFLLFFYLLFHTTHVIAQEIDSSSAPYTLKNKNTFRSIEVHQTMGSYLYTGHSLNSFLRHGFHAIDVRYAWQTTEEQEWASLANYPSIGIGFYSGFWGDPKTFGRPLALYGFIDYDIYKIAPKHKFTISAALGLTTALTPYHKENNPQNDAIGSRTTTFFDLKLGMNYQATRELDLLYGLSFSHFSNGRIRTPNLGLNMIGLYAGLKYYYNRQQTLLSKDIYTTNVLSARYQKPSLKRKINRKQKQSLSLYTAIGTNQNYKREIHDTNSIGKRYYPISIIFNYNYAWHKMHEITFGIDYFNDPSLYDVFPQQLSSYLVGAHIGYVLNTHNLSAQFQIGHLLTPDHGKGKIYFRPSLRYHIGKSFFTQVGLKTRNMFTADWIEFGIGIKQSFRKK